MSDSDSSNKVLVNEEPNKLYGTIKEEAGNKINNKPRACWGTRHTFAFMAFLGAGCCYSLRVNLSVAIVAMVQPGLGENDTSQMGDQCPVKNSSIEEKESSNTGGFNWDAEEQGIILGAFYYGYVVTQIPGGFLAEKYGGKWVFGLGTFIPAVLTLLTPLAAKAGSGVLVAVRVLVGLVEGFAWPALQAMISKWLPAEERSTFASLIWAGAQAGTVVALPISGLLADEVGWESVFYFFGALGIAWFLCWTLLCYDSPAKHPRISKEECQYIETNIFSRNEGNNLPFPPVWQFMKTPAVLALVLVHFGHNWGLYTLLTEIPTYLNNIQHFSLKANGFLSALPYLLMVLASLAIGWIADWLIDSGKLSTRNTRKLCNSVAHYGSAIGLIGLAFTGCNQTVAIVWLCLSVGLNGGVYSGFQVNHVDLSPNYAGTLMGITNMIANTTGFITPYVAGVITNNNQTIESWRTVFLITATMYVIFNTVFVFLAKAEIQPWNTYWETNEKMNKEQRGKA